MSLYLAEQYWPDVTRQRVQAGVAALSADGDGARAHSRLLAVLFLPGDECALYLAEGDDQAAVGALVARTGRPADRVQRCERLDLVPAGSPGHRGGRSRRVADAAAPHRPVRGPVTGEDGRELRA